MPPVDGAAAGKAPQIDVRDLTGRAAADDGRSDALDAERHRPLTSQAEQDARAVGGRYQVRPTAFVAYFGVRCQERPTARVGTAQRGIERSQDHAAGLDAV